MKIFAIAGSPREASYNRRLLALAVTSLESMGVQADLFDVREHRVPMFDPDVEAESGFPGVVKDLRARVLAADAVLFASPEYNAGYTPLMKSVIDWGSMSDPDTTIGNVWAGKVGAVIGASPGALGASRGMIALRQTLAHVEVLLIPEFTIVPRAHEAFDDGGNLKDERSAAGLTRVLDRLVEVADRLKQA